MSETFWPNMSLITVVALILVFLWGYSRNELLKFYKSDAEWWQNRHRKTVKMYEDANRRLREAEHKINKAQSVLVADTPKPEDQT